MKKLKRILSNTLNISEKLITDQTSPDNVKTWDSFTNLMLASELENEYKIRFSMDEINKFKNVHELSLILIKHGVKISNE